MVDVTPDPAKLPPLNIRGPVRWQHWPSVLFARLFFFVGLRLQFLHALLDSFKRILDALSLPFEYVGFLLAVHGRSKGCGVRRSIRHAAEGWETVAGALPTGEAGRAKPVSPSPSAAPLGCGSRASPPYTRTTVALTMGRGLPSFFLTYPRVMRVPHFGQVFWLHGCPTTWGVRCPHFGQTHFPSGPAA